MKKIEKLEKDPIGFISEMETVVNEDIDFFSDYLTTTCQNETVCNEVIKQIKEKFNETAQDSVYVNLEDQTNIPNEINGYFNFIAFLLATVYRKSSYYISSEKQICEIIGLDQEHYKQEKPFEKKLSLPLKEILDQLYIEKKVNYIFEYRILPSIYKGSDISEQFVIIHIEYDKRDTDTVEDNLMKKIMSKTVSKDYVEIPMDYIGISNNKHGTGLLNFLRQQESSCATAKEVLTNIMMLDSDIPLHSLKKKIEISINEINKLYDKGLIQFCVKFEYKSQKDNAPFIFLMKDPQYTQSVRE